MTWPPCRWPETVSATRAGTRATAARRPRVAISARRQGGLAVITSRTTAWAGADGAAGSGLRGLADRVEALGGRLHVVSPAGEGTVLSAEIPCVLVDGDAVSAHATRRAPT